MMRELYKSHSTSQSNTSTCRASNIQYSELRHIIIVGNMTFIKREWMLLRNLPKISVMDGNPLNRADIRAVKVATLIT